MERRRVAKRGVEREQVVHVRGAGARVSDDDERLGVQLLRRDRAPEAQPFGFF